MKLIFNIKPTILTGYGTTKDAKSCVRNSIRGCLSVSTRFGTAYTDSLRSDYKNVIAYNIEVFKRGKKYRNNKHYVVYRYVFPIEIFNLLNIEIEQGNRTFKIKSKKR
jgi:hypothetical protein